MLVFQPDGSIGLYTFLHVALATFVAVVAAVSLKTVDPLRLRSVAEPTPDIRLPEAPEATAVSEALVSGPDRRPSPL